MEPFEMRIKFNDEYYTTRYNKQTGYYEIELQAPEKGGIYQAEISFKGLFDGTFEDVVQDIQVLAKEEIKVETDKAFMWIFDYRDFKIKDIVEISNDYEISVDDETNINSTIKILKETTAKDEDIVAIKRNGTIVYWGIIEGIENNSGGNLYQYTLKNILNMFDSSVPVHKNIEDDNIEDGIYIIKTDVDTNKVLDIPGASQENEANVQIWTRNDTNAQKWKITKNTDGYFTFMPLCSDKVLDLDGGVCEDAKNVRLYNSNNSNAQRWKIEHVSDVVYYIKSKINDGYCVDVEGALPREGNNVYIYHQNKTTAQRFYFERLDEYLIRNVGIEDFIAKTIEDNFIKSSDVYLNKNYLEIRVKTHTKLNIGVSNVTDNMYNLQTWMANCTQLYNINYTFFVENGKLIIEIENKKKTKIPIDINTMNIIGYEEVFEAEVVSTVKVFTNTKSYTLYLLNDRTTTTDMMNQNRAKGRTERVYIKDYEEAEQKALDVIQSNRYNHNVTFKKDGEIIPVGTPVAIKTKKSVILDSYISAFKITKSKLIEYTCGNIRNGFIDKLLKERRS